MSPPQFFFTAEDPREIPKGSRDPLKFLPVWIPVARRMIPFLTTVTPSYRGFLTRFIFHGMLEDLAPAVASASIDQQWPVFCKFEQLCAVARAELQPSTPNFPGISGVSGRVKEGVVTVGSETDYWLVRSQKNTGYWGYYHQASLGSKLIQLNSAPRPGYRLSDEALEVYRNSATADLIKKLSPDLQKLIKQKRHKVELNKLQGFASFFAQKPLLDKSGWGQFWLNHLLIPRANNVQSDSDTVLQDFAQRLQSAATAENSASQVWELLAEKGDSSSVTHFASEVISTEAVIGLCEWVFDACRLRHPENDLTSSAQWAYKNGYNDDWLNKLRRIGEPKDSELQRLRHIALSDAPNTFEDLARELLKRHKSIMASRKGAAWVEINEDDKLTIRDPSEEPWLPDFQRFPSGIRWRYDYMLASWISIGREIGFLE